MGLSFASAAAIIGVSFILILQIFTTSLPPIISDVTEAYDRMKDRAVEQCQTDMNITSIVDIGWWDTSWANRKLIIINHSMVQEDQKDFPVLIYRSADAELAAQAKSNGDDIIFVSGDNSTQYNHEIEEYDNSTGELTAWVKIPTLSSTQDTTLLMYYGNPSSSNQENITGTWDGNYRMVQHLNESSGTLYDSTSYGNNGTNNGASYNASSKIDGGYDFDGSDSINCGDDPSLDIITAITLEGWVKDPPFFGRSRQRCNVRIVDKQDEQRSIAPGEQFTVQRTVATDIATEVVFVALCSPGITLNGMSVDGISVFDREYVAGMPTSVQEFGIERIRNRLPDELKELEMLVYSKPFTVDNNQVIIKMDCEAGEHQMVSDGQISYLVFAADDCYDYEGTTHWHYPVLIDWFNPFSVAKAIIDLLTGQHSIDDVADWTNETFVTTTQYEGVIKQPVKWTKEIRFENKHNEIKEFIQEISIPAYALEITIVDENGTIIDEITQVNHTEKHVGNYTFEINETMGTDETKSFFVHYTTPGPNLTEIEVSSLQKRVVVSSDIHYTNISAHTTIDNRSKGSIHLYHIINDTRIEVDFNALDLDNDTLIDRIEWIVSHLSEQVYEVVIEITKAEHLDENRSYISDIYDEVKAKDDIWCEPTNDQEYVRVTFERSLDNSNDITIFARSNGIAEIEVYTMDNDTLITKFDSISGENWYKIYLTNLNGNHAVFDLRTIGDFVEYDYIVDPAPQISDPYPANQSTDVSVNPTLNITVNDADGDSMTLTWYSNSSGTWQIFGTNTSCSNNTYYMSNSNFSNYSITYYWSVNLTDGTDWCNETYHFTTIGTTTFSMLDDPTEDGYIQWGDYLDAGFQCPIPDEPPTILRFADGTYINFGMGSGYWHWYWIFPTSFRPGYWEKDWRAHKERGYVEWDISSLAGKTLTANPVFKYEGGRNYAYDERINPITEGQPSVISDEDLYDYIASGTAYVDPFVVERGATSQEVDLGASARSDLQNAMDAGQSWFAIGFKAGEIGNMALETQVMAEEDVPTPSPTLYVEYIPSNNAPTQTGESPTNGSADISLIPALYVICNDADGDNLNASWWSNSSGAWLQFASNWTSFANNTNITQSFTNATAYATKYWWSVNCTDGTDWTNETYHFTTVGANKEIISKGRSAYSLEISPDGDTLYGYVNGTNVTTSIDTQWHYVVLTYDGNTLTIYKDGEQKNSTNLVGSIPTNAIDLILGTNLSGTLDEIRVSNTARSAAWINTSYKMTNSPTTFISVEPEQNQQYTYLSITIKNTGSATIKITEFTLIVNGTEKPIIDLQPYLYPRKEMDILVNVLAVGTKRNKLITGNCISDCEEYG